MDHTAEDISTIMSTNFEATYHFSQLAHPLLKASGHGAIVNISSISTSKVLPGVSAYAASKGKYNLLCLSHKSSASPLSDNPVARLS